MRLLRSICMLSISACASMNSGPRAKLSIRKMEAEPVLAPTTELGLQLEAISVDGAAVMHGGVIVNPLSFDDQHGDVDCDIVRFELRNKGSIDLRVGVLEDHPTVPFFLWEVFVDGRWTEKIPVLESDGALSERQSCGWNYPGRDIVLVAGDSVAFPMYVERWRYSVVHKMRLRLLSLNPRTNLNEDVVSNSFSLVAPGGV